MAFSGEMTERASGGVDRHLCSEFFSDRIAVMEVLYQKTGDPAYQPTPEHLAVINRVTQRQKNFSFARSRISEPDLTCHPARHLLSFNTDARRVRERKWSLAYTVLAAPAPLGVRFR